MALDEKAFAEADVSGHEMEKRAWLRSIQGKDFEATLFPFEMLLRAMDRFFRTDNHPRFQSCGPTQDCSMKIEVAIADNKFRSLIQLSQSILDDTDTSAFMFQSYVETQLVSDIDRDALLVRHSHQGSPLESLYLLRIGLQSLVNITQGLENSPHVSPAVFHGIGHNFASLLLHNRFFNPFREHGFNPLYDRVDHPLLRRGVRMAPTRALRNALSLLVLVLSRHLRVATWIDPHASSRIQLQSSLPYLCLLCSEFRSLIPYLENTLPKQVFTDGPLDRTETELASFLDSFCYQLTRESRKVFEQLLAGFPDSTEVSKLRSALENTRGLLTTFLQQAIVSAVQIVLPEVEGKDIFRSFVSRRDQASRLREDLWTFHELLAAIGPFLAEESKSPEQKRRALTALLDYSEYFGRHALPAIRLSDLEEFERFFDKVRSLKNKAFTSLDRAREISRYLEVFRIFLQTTFELVSKRTDIQGVEFQSTHPRRVLHQFLQVTEEEDLMRIGKS